MGKEVERVVVYQNAVPSPIKDVDDCIGNYKVQSTTPYLVLLTDPRETH